jgi:hypothetical protein
MVSAAPPLSLTHERARRLQVYLQTYRRYAFASLLPSVDRNTTLRILQAMQGKLIDVMDQKTALLQLVLATEEMTTLKTIITEVLLLYAKQPASAERTATLADLTALKTSLKG